MERLINRRQQGDLGEASAIEWLTRRGATVLAPLGHSPDYDLVAEVGGQLLRVQVKTSTMCDAKPSGNGRWKVQIATNGGNQSWSGVAKRFDPLRADYLFVLVGDGRRWFLPTQAVEATTNIRLGGSKYSEFEIDSSFPIRDLVYGSGRAHLESTAPGEYRSGQTGGAVNAMAQPSQVRILPPPSASFEPAKYERLLGRSGQAAIYPKRRLTIPQQPFIDAGFHIGDRVRARCDGAGRVVLTRIGKPTQVAIDERDADGPAAWGG